MTFGATPFFPFHNDPIDGSTMNDSQSSYRCEVSSGNTSALLRLGWHRFPVDVVVMSRESFTVRVPAKIAKRVTVGIEARLFYQDMLWSVLCTDKWIGKSKLVDLEFKQLAELTEPKISIGFGGKCKATPAYKHDNTISVATAIALIITILIMPAWGGQWGTSDAICSVVQATFTAIVQLVTGTH